MVKTCQRSSLEGVISNNTYFIFQESLLCGYSKNSVGTSGQFHWVTTILRGWCQKAVSANAWSTSLIWSFVFSSPEHMLRMNFWDRSLSVVQRPSVRSHFQTTSHLTSLTCFHPNFVWIINAKGGQKLLKVNGLSYSPCCHGNHVPNLKRSSFPRPVIGFHLFFIKMFFQWTVLQIPSNDFISLKTWPLGGHTCLWLFRKFCLFSTYHTNLQIGSYSFQTLQTCSPLQGLHYDQRT